MEEVKRTKDSFEQEIRRCWDEASNAAPLTDEEIDQIVHEVRREILAEREKGNGMNFEKDLEACWEEYKDAPPFSDEELKQIIRDCRRMIRNSEDMES